MHARARAQHSKRIDNPAGCGAANMSRDEARSMVTQITVIVIIIIIIAVVIIVLIIMGCNLKANELADHSGLGHLVLPSKRNIAQNRSSIINYSVLPRA